MQQTNRSVIPAQCFTSDFFVSDLDPVRSPRQITIAAAAYYEMDSV